MQSVHISLSLNFILEQFCQRLTIFIDFAMLLEICEIETLHLAVLVPNLFQGENETGLRN